MQVPIHRISFITLGKKICGIFVLEFWWDCWNYKDGLKAPVGEKLILWKNTKSPFEKGMLGFKFPALLFQRGPVSRFKDESATWEGSGGGSCAPLWKRKKTPKPCCNQNLFFNVLFPLKLVV